MSCPYRYQLCLPWELHVEAVVTRENLVNQALEGVTFEDVGSLSPSLEMMPPFQGLRHGIYLDGLHPPLSDSAPSGLMI